MTSKDTSSRIFALKSLDVTGLSPKMSNLGLETKEEKKDQIKFIAEDGYSVMLPLSAFKQEGDFFEALQSVTEGTNEIKVPIEAGGDRYTLSRVKLFIDHHSDPRRPFKMNNKNPKNNSIKDITEDEWDETFINGVFDYGVDMLARLRNFGARYGVGSNDDLYKLAELRKEKLVDEIIDDENQTYRVLAMKNFNLTRVEDSLRLVNRMIDYVNQYRMTTDSKRRQRLQAEYQIGCYIIKLRFPKNNDIRCAKIDSDSAIGDLNNTKDALLKLQPQELEARKVDLKFLEEKVENDMKEVIRLNQENAAKLKARQAEEEKKSR